MRTVIVWRDNTDYARQVTDWLHDFTHRTGRTPESLDPDTREGESFARAYDIVQYPTIIVVADHNGSEQKRWPGLPLPLIDEAAAYA